MTKAQKDKKKLENWHSDLGNQLSQFDEIPLDTIRGIIKSVEELLALQKRVSDAQGFADAYKRVYDVFEHLDSEHFANYLEEQIAQLKRDGLIPGPDPEDY